jgi:hypothetical protein
VRLRTPGAASKQRMVREALPVHVSDFRQGVEIGCDDQLGIAVRARSTHAVRLSTSHKHDLVRISDDVFASHLPHEQPTVRQAHLEVRTEVFRARFQRPAFAAQVFNDANRQIEEARA